MNTNLNVILIVHNQFEVLQQSMEILKTIENIPETNIVIIDNASTDGLRTWLESNRNLNYLVCDEGLESYAVILNTAIREFRLCGDILILTAECIVLPGCLNEMQKILHQNESTGAVSGTMLYYGSDIGKTYMSAIEYVNTVVEEESLNKQKLGLAKGAILIKADMLNSVGEFDEDLILPENVIMDFLFMGLQKGFKYYECGKAFFYKIPVQNGYHEKYSKDVDRKTLKYKWNMNYFNTKANVFLIENIKHQKDEPIQILEIGCDCGATLLEIYNNYPKSECYGLEINPNAAEIASCVAKVKLGNIEKETDFFEGVKFDYIIFGDVLEHLHDPARVIRNCREILKKEGRIIASIPNLMHYSVLKELLNGNFTYTDIGLLDKTHIHFFTYNEIIKMFEAEKFQIEAVECLNNKEIEENEDFISKLMLLSECAAEFMFKTYQYLVVAKV